MVQGYCFIVFPWFSPQLWKITSVQYIMAKCLTCICAFQWCKGLGVKMTKKVADYVGTVLCYSLTSTQK